MKAVKLFAAAIGVVVLLTMQSVYAQDKSVNREENKSVKESVKTKEWTENGKKLFSMQYEVKVKPNNKAEYKEHTFTIEQSSTVDINLQTSNPDISFVVQGDDGETIGKGKPGNKWEGALKNDGKYTVKVKLPLETRIQYSLEITSK